MMSPATKSFPESVNAFAEVGTKNPAATVNVATAARTRFQKLDKT